MQIDDRRTGWRWPLTAFLCGLFALSCFMFPMYVIRPFRHQDPRELSLALFVIQIAPWLSLLCAALAAGATLASLRQGRRCLPRAMAITGAFLALVGVGLSRVNIFEIMFHPAGMPQFEPVSQAHIDGDDMVIAVRVNGSARAYPIREMAYHHLVNDVLAGEPIVPTY